MNFNAVQNSINDILSVKRKYIIPRNQREFSWEKMQLDEFWDDVTRNIKLNEKGEFTYSEYFLGTIVLAGSDSSPSLDVIDGQQRLTVITMAITTISRILRDLGFEEYADDVFNAYVVTNVSQVALSKSPQRSAKLEKTNGNDFFKLKFQDKVDHEPKVVFEEDAKLLYAGKYLNRKLSKASACELWKKNVEGLNILRKTTLIA